jgi:glycerol uptake facilitator-like aquaporin
MSMPWRLRVGALIFVFAAMLVALVLTDFEPSSYGVTHLTVGLLLSVIGASLIRSGSGQLNS